MHVAATLSLMPYQEEGVNFLLERPVELEGQPHRLLADEMGLGKTVQACVALKRSRAKSALVVVPHPIKDTWAVQLERWGACTEEQIFIVRTGADVIPDSATHIIVNYDLVNGEIKKQLMKRYFAVLIVDEAQKLKGIHSLRSHHVLGQDGLVRRAFMKWFLSGTIMPNRPIELYTLLKTMAPQCIAPHLGWEDYGKYFCNGFTEKFGGWNFKGAAHIDELRDRIKPFMLRREVKDVYPELPPAIQSDVFMDVGDMLEDEGNTPTATLRMLVGQKKMPFVVDFIKDKLDDGDEEKILVFTFSRSVTEGLEQELAKYGAVKYYGGMSPTAKEEAKRRFLKDSNCRVMVAQIISAGTGIDELQHVCSTIVFAELDWSAGDYDQAICRLRRIGQQKIVRVYKCIAVNTLDEPMDGSRRNKKKVMDRLLKPQEKQMAIEDLLKEQNAILTRIANALEGQAGVAQMVNETKPEPKPEGKPQGKPADKKPQGKPAGTATAAASKPADKTAAAGAGGSNADDPKGSTATSAGASSEVAAPTTQDKVTAVQDSARAALKRLGSGNEARDAVRGVFQQFGAQKATEIAAEHLDDAVVLLEALGAEGGDDLIG